MTVNRLASVIAAVRVLGASLIVATLTVSYSDAEPCIPESIGVDVSMADTTMAAFHCRGMGQVFVAEETLIRAITVWRPAEPAVEAFYRYLFITETDSLGRPDTQEILLHGMPLQNRFGDGIHPVPYRFEFDQPFELPQKGRYAFIVQATWFNLLSFLASANDPYADGEAWWTSPAWDCAQPIIPKNRDPVDLVFEIEFCDNDLPTDVWSTSWGKLKLIYR